MSDKEIIKLAFVDDECNFGYSFQSHVDQYNRSGKNTCIVHPTIFTDPKVFLASHEHYDCVLLDIYMPQMNGIQVFEELKRLRRLDSVILFNSSAVCELAENRTCLDKTKARVSDVIERYYEFKGRMFGNVLNLNFSIQGLELANA